MQLSLQPYAEALEYSCGVVVLGRFDDASMQLTNVHITRHGIPAETIGDRFQLTVIIIHCRMVRVVTISRVMIAIFITNLVLVFLLILAFTV